MKFTSKTFLCVNWIKYYFKTNLLWGFVISIFFLCVSGYSFSSDINFCLSSIEKVFLLCRKRRTKFLEIEIEFTKKLRLMPTKPNVSWKRNLERQNLKHLTFSSLDFISISDFIASKRLLFYSAYGYSNAWDASKHWNSFACKVSTWFTFKTQA